MAWIRAHPDYATDPVFRQRIIEADQEAQRDSKRVGTAEYYARLDRRAAEHSVDAGGAARGEPVMLTDDKLEVARGIWQSMHPYDPPPDVKTLSRAWHEWNHSPQAHRQREQSAERQAFQGAASSLRPRW